MVNLQDENIKEIEIAAVGVSGDLSAGSVPLVLWSANSNSQLTIP